MGNMCNRGGESGSGFSFSWTSWRLTLNQDRARQTFQKMGCISCLAFFVFGKFLCLALLFVLPVVMIGMGSYYLKDCPYSHIIPIFLIVLGVYGALETIVYVLRSCAVLERCEVAFIIWEFTKIIMFGFFTWGSVLIYQIYEPNYKRGQARYCNKTLYLFAFSVVTILWILVALMVMMCLLMVAMLACSKDETAENEPPRPPAGRPNRT